MPHPDRVISVKRTIFGTRYWRPASLKSSVQTSSVSARMTEANSPRLPILL